MSCICILFVGVFGEGPSERRDRLRELLVGIGQTYLLLFLLLDDFVPPNFMSFSLNAHA